MTSLRLILDARRPDPEGRGVVRLQILRARRAVYITTSVRCLPSSWDAARQRVKSSTRMASASNTLLQRLVADAATRLRELEAAGEITPTTTAQGVRELLLREQGATRKPKEPADLLSRWMAKTVAMHQGRTAELYRATEAKLRRYLGASYDALRLSAITVGWLDEWDAWMAQHGEPSANSRGIQLRNLRRVFNTALDFGADVPYPWRRYRIKTQATPKRSLTVEQLRAILRDDCAGQPHLEQYRDLFALSFMLIGINFVDLFGLRTVVDGRVEYRRSKTHRLYSIKVEPEALELIERWRGERALLSIADRNTDYRTAYNTVTTSLAQLRDRHHLPALTTYWARHTWATVAASLDIPRDTIAHALGHGGNTVTDIYIDFDRAKVDEANRRVLDWVLYGKKLPQGSE